LNHNKHGQQIPSEFFYGGNNQECQQQFSNDVALLSKRINRFELAEQNEADIPLQNSIWKQPSAKVQ